MATTPTHDAIAGPVHGGNSPPWLADRVSVRLLEYTAGLYAVAWVVHTGDHLRRGLDVVTTQVAVLGSVAAVLQLAAVALVFLRFRWAPILAAAIGIPDAIGIAAVHLLPHWSAFSDAFPGAHGAGVTTLSWVAAIMEIVGALAFGLAGMYAWRRARGAAVADGAAWDGSRRSPSTA
ncbi:MAG: hypothetical protein QOG64_1285 [Acidimicrobiaceae bacterium]|nr:hypothetical protein [Acidimicrobiaceae bacterium]